MRLLLRSATIRAIVGATPIKLHPRGPVVKLSLCESRMKLFAQTAAPIVIQVGTVGLRGPPGKPGPEGPAGVGLPATNIRENMPLVGAIDGINSVYTLPGTDKAVVYFPGMKIKVHVNGHRLASTDYSMSESGGTGTGYDTVSILTGPVSAGDVLEADYLKA